MGELEVRTQMFLECGRLGTRQHVVHCVLLVGFQEPAKTIAGQELVVQGDVLDARRRIPVVHIHLEIMLDDRIERGDVDGLLRLLGLLVEIGGEDRVGQSVVMDDIRDEAESHGRLKVLGVHAILEVYRTGSCGADRSGREMLNTCGHFFRLLIIMREEDGYRLTVRAEKP